MTTKEIANAVGKDERTVQRWVKKLSDKMSSVSDKMSVSSPTYPADYTEEETLLIIETGMGKNAAGIYRANLENSQGPQLKAVSGLSPVDVEVISQLISTTVALTIEKLDKRIQRVEQDHEEKKALLPPPGVSVKTQINNIVRDKAHSEGGSGKDFSHAWTHLYAEFRDRYHIDLKARARNRRNETGKKATGVDIAESLGMLDQLLSLAILLYSPSWRGAR